VFVTRRIWLHLEGSAFCGSPAAGIWCTIPQTRGANLDQYIHEDRLDVGGGPGVDVVAKLDDRANTVIPTTARSAASSFRKCFPGPPAIRSPPT